MVTQPGPKNPNWGGGKAVTSHGYQLVKVDPRHPLANANGYAYRHRLAASEAIGRPLRPGERVSFRDGDKTNCSPANLVVRAKYTDDERRALHVRRATLRKRGITPVPTIGKEALTELFEGKCAYCGASATCFDHVDPVVIGGRTEPGNMLPACAPCNGSKHSHNVWEWVDATGRELPWRTVEWLIDNGHLDGAYPELEHDGYPA